MTAETPPPATPTSSPPAIDDRDRFINRELTWLQFNRRVLDEARDASVPLLERVKFLSIASTNLDEFFEIRVAGLMELVDAGLSREGPDALTAQQELEAVRTAARAFNAEIHEVWSELLVPDLDHVGIRLPAVADLDDGQQRWLRQYFEREVLPILTPLAIDPAHPFPSLHNKSLNLAVLLLDPRAERVVHRLAMVQVPRALPRILLLPGSSGGGRDYVFQVDLIKEYLDDLFPGLSVLHTCSFRVTRDSNIDLDEGQDTDLMKSLEAQLARRRRGEPVRIEIDENPHPEILGSFLEAFELDADDVHECSGPVNLGRLMELVRLEDHPDYKYPRFVPHTAVRWDSAESMFSRLKHRDLLLHHPFDSFTTVEDFVRLAAHDPRVLAIKHTIYRAGETSAIIRDLIHAAEMRKQVTVVVELKARFDEEANIRWAKRMERAGIHVVYGIVSLKTHAKATLIVRREEHGMVRYCHLGTGNYNPTTARLYTDIGLLTGRQALCRDVADMFNMITGYAQVPDLEHLIVAPYLLRKRMTSLILREAENARAGRPARIYAKMNALTDGALIEALYAASQAGVEIKLCVRGACCLRPGVPGLSERIEVVSIVGRFLEHSRLFYFENAGEPEVFAGSADWMTRNLDRRVEALFPLLDPSVRQRVESILLTCLSDNVKARRILPDGTYELRQPTDGESVCDSQARFVELAQEPAADGNA